MPLGMHVEVQENCIQQTNSMNSPKMLELLEHLDLDDEKTHRKRLLEDH